MDRFGVGDFKYPGLRRETKNRCNAPGLHRGSKPPNAPREADHRGQGSKSRAPAHCEFVERPPLVQDENRMPRKEKRGSYLCGGLILLVALLGCFSKGRPKGNQVKTCERPFPVRLVSRLCAACSSGFFVRVLYIFPLGWFSHHLLVAGLVEFPGGGGGVSREDMWGILLCLPALVAGGTPFSAYRSS